MEQKFNFIKLDERTRALMLEEITIAQQTSQLYKSARFNDIGEKNYTNWLLSAATNHDELWLTQQIITSNAIKSTELRTNPNGSQSNKNTPSNTAETWAEGQFNRFYMAAICRRAMDDSKNEVFIYRAKQRNTPRSVSTALEDSRLNAAELLKRLQDKNLSFKLDILQPNSGLSIDY